MSSHYNVYNRHYSERNAPGRRSLPVVDPASFPGRDVAKRIHRQSYSAVEEHAESQAAIVIPLDSLPDDIDISSSLEQQVSSFHHKYGPQRTANATSSSSVAEVENEDEEMDTISEFVHHPENRRGSITASFHLPNMLDQRNSNDSNNSTASIRGSVASYNLTSPLGRSASSSENIFIHACSRIPLFGHAEVLSDSAHRSDVVVLAVDSDYVHIQLLQMHSCYEVLPYHSKIVALDVKMPLNKAFYALVFNGVRIALLWDSDTEKFVGTISNTDFIHALITYERQYSKEHHTTNTGDRHSTQHSNASSVETITTSPVEPLPQQSSPTSKKKGKDDRVAHSQIIDQYLYSRTIKQWRQERCNHIVGVHRPLFAVGAKTSLFHAARIMKEHHLYRLVIFGDNSNSPMAILTHSRILRFLFIQGERLRPPPLFDELPKNAGVGTWTNLKFVRESTKLWDTMNMLIDEQISGVPVLHDSNDTVVDIYSRFDIISLVYNDATSKFKDIEMREALMLKKQLQGAEKVGRPNVITSTSDQTLGQVLSTLVDRNIYRVIIVHPETKVLEGIITASDMVRHLVKPAYNIMGSAPVTPAAVEDLYRTSPTIHSTCGRPRFRLESESKA